MHNFKVEKKYRTEEVPDLEIYVENNAEGKPERKTREVTKKVKVLETTQTMAFELAESAAQELKYASISLIREDPENYTFQFYNKIEEPKKKKKAGEDK